MVRAVKLKDALTLYQDHYIKLGKIDSADCFACADWNEITDLIALLKPLAKASKTAQLVGETSGNGLLHTVLTEIEHLLDHLETSKNRQTHLPASHFKASVNLGWKKLEKYYSLSNLTPAYCLAFLLNLWYKMQWFNKHWNSKPAWRADVSKIVAEAYKAAKKLWADDMPQRASPRRDKTAYEAFNDLSEDEEEDELQRYLNAPRLKGDAKDHPLDWWAKNESLYPVLSHLAYELLAAPSSTAASERLFSMAGNVVNKERSMTQQELAEAV